MNCAGLIQQILLWSAAVRPDRRLSDATEFTRLARACSQIRAGVADRLQRSAQTRLHTAAAILTRGRRSCGNSFSERPR